MGTGLSRPRGGYNQLLDPLVLQRMSVQTNLESTSQKLAAARRGESLERDQFSKRLEVLNKPFPHKGLSNLIAEAARVGIICCGAAGFAGFH